jgi:hypothetical protein
MSSRTNIDPLSITDGKISNQAKINPKKVAPADEASFLITQSDKKYQSKKIHGDGTIDASGKLTITGGVGTEEEILPLDSVKIGPANYDDTENRTKRVGTGASAIPVRDTSGNLKAETADKATTAENSEKLDSKDGTYYTDTGNHTSGTASAISTSGGGIAGTSQPFPTHLVIANNTTGQSGPSTYTVEHGFGSHPLSVQLNETTNDSGTYVDGDEIEAHVSSTNTTTTIQFSKSNILFRARLLGLKS